MRRRERQVTALCCLLAVLPLVGFWSYGLFDLDEGFYAAAAREMLRRGEWITPYYNGQPWFEKPILLYWLAIPSIRVFGETVGPRLPSFLCSLGTLWAVFAFVRPIVGLAAARTSIMVLGSSLLFVGIGRMMLADPPLVLTLSFALLFFFRSLTGGSSSSRLWSALFLGLSVLAKGPVGGLLFVLIVGITYWREPLLRPAFRGGWLLGIVIFLASVSLWYVPAYLANGEGFVQEFLIEQNLGRFTGGDAAHSIGGPLNWVFYLLVLLAGMLPWAFMLPWAWPKGFRVPTEPQAEGEGVRDAFLRFCARWALVVIVFFSLSGAKLPHYIAPALPPLAIVIGAWLAARSRAKGGLPVGQALACVIAAPLAGLGFQAYYYGANLGGLTIPGFHAEVHRLTRWVKAQGGEVAVYQMSRREADRGTGSTRLRETAHPSILFYLDKTVLDTDDMADLLSHPGPIWIITRAGRISEEDRSWAKRRGRAISDPKDLPPQDLYRVYRLE